MGTCESLTYHLLDAAREPLAIDTVECYVDDPDSCIISVLTHHSDLTLHSTG